MPKLLVEHPDGNQQIIEIDQSGGFFDQSKILWDERRDGALPEGVVAGKMQRQGNALVLLGNFTTSYLQLKQQKDQENINTKTAKLWAAADAYIYATINGVALSILALGVHQQKPKASAVAAWCDSVWAEYYTRKALITAEAEPNIDFSSLGDKPYTVLELREEVAASWVNPL